VNVTGPILRIFSLTLVGLLLPAGAPAATISRDPAPHDDQADAAQSPLDIRAAAFGQRGTELVLRVTTAGEWDAAALAPGSGAALCVRIFYGTQTSPRSRLCVIDKGANKPGLAVARLDPVGTVVENRIVSARTSRSDKRSLEAVFEPSAANLRRGPYRWQVHSTWACVADVCADTFPDNGNVSAQIRPLAEPRCLGAASRDPRHRCINDALRLAVIPPPAEAVLSPNARCTIISIRLPYTCQFGVRASIANRTVALVGDSHAAHWRGALEVAAQARGWRGFSLTRSGCPLSAAPPAVSKAQRASCARWRRAVRRWLGRHPKVKTVFVSQLAGGTSVRAPAGRSRREYQIQGYLRAWRRLPKSVRQIIVLRDTPVTTPNASVCVQQAFIDRRRAGTACAISRPKAVRRDPAAIAARRRGLPRVHVIDLTRHMCSPRMCFPVIGGVLVHKDTTHMTPLFASTLGPFVLRRVARLL
jgi:SGNH domain (fused to AT3 domains)